MGFLGVPLINGGSGGGLFNGFVEVLWDFMGVLWGVLKGTKRLGENVHKILNF